MTRPTRAPARASETRANAETGVQSLPTAKRGQGKEKSTCDLRKCFLHFMVGDTRFELVTPTVSR